MRKPFVVGGSELEKGVVITKIVLFSKIQAFERGEVDFTQIKISKKKSPFGLFF